MTTCNCNYAGVCIDGAVRLQVTLDDSVPLALSHYLIEDRLSVGRVEVCQGGHYGTVCRNAMTTADASVVCTQLGFSPYGECGNTFELFGESRLYYYELRSLRGHISTYSNIKRCTHLYTFTQMSSPCFSPRCHLAAG